MKSYEIQRKERAMDYPELSKKDRSEIQKILSGGLTMTTSRNLSFTTITCKNLVNSEVRGDFVEVGVWRGGHLAAAILNGFGESGRVTYGIDTFSGMTVPEAFEFNIRSSYSASKRFDELENGKGWQPMPITDVQSRIAAIVESNTTVNKTYKLKLLERDITLAKKSDFEEIKFIAFLRLDVDFYKATLASLNLFYEKVFVGGVVVLDDYGSWSGCAQAISDFFKKESLPLPMLYPIDNSARFFVKLS